MDNYFHRWRIFSYPIDKRLHEPILNQIRNCYKYNFLHCSMEKKGDGGMTARQIAIILLSLAGFVLVLMLVVQLFFLNELSDYELCHTSVIARAQTPQAESQYIPLKCKTKKTCITSDENCNQFIAEDKVTKVKIQENDPVSVRKIEETLANGMYDCWSMMGEGKLDLFNGGVRKYTNWESQRVTCLICSRVAINVEDAAIMSQIDINEYLKNNPAPGTSTSYLSAFTDRGTNSYARATIAPKQEDIGGTFTKESLNEYAIVFTQIKPEDYSTAFGKLAGFGASVAGATFMTPGIKALASTPLGVTIAVAGGAGVTLYAMSNVYDGKVASAGFCGDFTSTDDAEQRGCSTVQILPYEVNTINSICTQLEGSA